MTFYPDQRYAGTIANGQLIESQKGTPGFQVQIDTENDGTMMHTVWITSANREYAEKDLVTLGADPAKLTSPSYLEHELPAAVVGVEVVFGTKEEVYKEKRSVKVAWIGKPKAPASSSLFGSVASIFGGSPEPQKPAVEFADDDIPFALFLAPLAAALLGVLA